MAGIEALSVPTEFCRKSGNHIKNSTLASLATRPNQSNDRGHGLPGYDLVRQPNDLLAEAKAASKIDGASWTPCNSPPSPMMAGFPFQPRKTAMRSSLSWDVALWRWFTRPMTG